MEIFVLSLCLLIATLTEPSFQANTNSKGSRNTTSGERGKYKPKMHTVDYEASKKPMKISSSVAYPSGWFMGPHVCAEQEVSKGERLRAHNDNIQCVGNNEKFFCSISFVMENVEYLIKHHYQCCKGFHRPKSHPGNGCIKRVSRTDQNRDKYLKLGR